MSKRAKFVFVADPGGKDRPFHLVYVGPIFVELWNARELTFQGATHGYRLDGRRGTVPNRKQLSAAARRLVNDCYRQLTGMHLPCNEYYFPDAMSEAIEAAYELGI